MQWQRIHCCRKNRVGGIRGGLENDYSSFNIPSRRTSCVEGSTSKSLPLASPPKEALCGQACRGQTLKAPGTGRHIGHTQIGVPPLAPPQRQGLMALLMQPFQVHGSSPLQQVCQNHPNFKQRSVKTSKALNTGGKSV